MSITARLSLALDYIQTHHPRFADLSHWVNAGFTIGNITLTTDVSLKLLAFLFVTVPLGIVQWWNLADRWRERRAKKNAAR